MSSRVAHHSGFRIVIALITCAALIPLPSISSLVSEAAQDQVEHGKGKPRPGKPEGNWPDLEELKKESKVGREAPPPIPSTMRSPKLSEKPWDGRRVGDPETTGRHSDQAVVVNRKLRRAHARSRVTPVLPPMEENTFIQNFFSQARKLRASRVTTRSEIFSSRLITVNGIVSWHFT